MTRSDIREGIAIARATVRLGLTGLRLTAKLGWIIASELIAEWRQR